MAVAYSNWLHKENALITPDFWCAVQVVAQHEFVVATALAGQGYSQLLPTYKKRRQWSDRTKVLDAPLFPGYVFCRIKNDSWLNVIRSPGVRRIVSFGGKICPIPECEIAALDTIVRLGIEASPYTGWKVGQKVQVMSGALAGIVGMLESLDNRSQLIISVETLMRSISVKVDGCDVLPV